MLWPSEECGVKRPAWAWCLPLRPLHADGYYLVSREKKGLHRMKMHLLNNDKSFSILNKAACMETMLKIYKKTMLKIYKNCSRSWSGPVKHANINSSFISHLVVRYSLVFSFTSGFWKQHRVDLGNRDKDVRKHSQWSWNGPIQGYYRHLALPGKVFVWSLYVLVSCSLYPARFIAVLIALSVIAPAVFSLAMRNVSRNVLMLL